VETLLDVGRLFFTVETLLDVGRLFFTVETLLDAELFVVFEVDSVASAVFPF